MSLNQYNTNFLLTFYKKSKVKMSEAEEKDDILNETLWKDDVSDTTNMRIRKRIRRRDARNTFLLGFAGIFLLMGFIFVLVTNPASNELNALRSVGFAMLFLAFVISAIAYDLVLKTTNRLCTALVECMLSNPMTKLVERCGFCAYFIGPLVTLTFGTTAFILGMVYWQNNNTKVLICFEVFAPLTLFTAALSYTSFRKIFE